MLLVFGEAGCVGGAAGDDPGPIAEIASAVVNGQAAGVCQWPSCLFGRGCSASLVHPRLTTVAAHCVQEGQTDGVANVGEQAPFVRTVQRQICHRPPQYTTAGQTGAYDIAFCVLQEAIDGVPIVPVLSACEAEQVMTPGRTVVIAGFGAPNNGHKFFGEMTVTGVRNGAEVLLRGNGVTAGEGDSGGPGYVKMPDGTWRLFGVASRAGGNTAIYTLISPHVAWIEQTSGLDITPCHGPSGGWEGGPGCDRFPTDPGGTSNGTWDDLCSAIPVAKPAPTCSADWQPGDGGLLPPPPRADGAAADATAPAADVRPPAAPDTAPPPPPDAAEIVAVDAAIAEAAPRPSPSPDAPAVPPVPRVSAGCSCVVGGIEGSMPPGMLLALAALALRRRR